MIIDTVKGLCKEIKTIRKAYSRLSENDRHLVLQYAYYFDYNQGFVSIFS